MSDDQNSEPMDAYEALELISDERKLEVASAIGKVTLAWNKLQESLALLFASIFRHNGEAALAVWHSQKNDLAQRNMIRAAAQANENELRSDVIDEIKWLLDRADSLSIRRNDTIHTHFSLRIEGSKIAYLPDEWSGSKHAKNLQGKDPLAEFNRYSIWADRLSQYAIELREYIRDPCDNSALPGKRQKPR